MGNGCRENDGVCGGWTYSVRDEMLNFIRRARRKLTVILRRRAACFKALTQQELTAYLHEDRRSAHIIPTNSRNEIVNELIRLRLPAPKLSEHSSRRFCKTLYELMTMYVCEFYV